MYSPQCTQTEHCACVSVYTNPVVTYQHVKASCVYCDIVCICQYCDTTIAMMLVASVETRLLLLLPLTLASSRHRQVGRLSLHLSRDWSLTILTSMYMEIH